MAADLFDRAAEFSEEEGTQKEFWCLVHRAYAFSKLQKNNFNYRHAVCEYLYALELYDESLSTPHIDQIFKHFANLLLNSTELGYDTTDVSTTEEYKAGNELLEKFKNGEMTSISNVKQLLENL